ncbi:MAG: hypothetical protein ACU0DK_14010 [Pseudooceanicola sp.]
MRHADGAIGGGDILQAYAAAVAASVVLGAPGSPLILSLGVMSLLMAMLVPVAMVVAALAIPVALFCIRMNVARVPAAVLAGLVFGGLGVVFGSWFWDCTVEVHFFGRCHRHPLPQVAAYGAPFGVMGSLAFRTVLRQRAPAAFGRDAPMERDRVLRNFILLWLASAMASFLVLKAEVGFR